MPQREKAPLDQQNLGELQMNLCHFLHFPCILSLDWYFGAIAEFKMKHISDMYKQL